jgi:tRNA(Arg) A34 adenosine deaminase TadA
MLETRVGTESRDDEYGRFAEAGSNATGEFHCADCGYGVTVYTRLPACPMCAGRIWEQSTFGRLVQPGL